MAPDTDAAPAHRLVLEPDMDGHAREWLWHLLAYLDQRPSSGPVTFVLAQDMVAELRAQLPAELAERVRLVALHPIERRLCIHRRMVISAFARWWVMRRYLRLTGADSGHFQALDHLCLPLALGLGLSGRPVDGILFRPSVHYGTLGPYKASFTEGVRDWRKSMLYRLMLTNRALRTVLSLDPYFPAYAAKRFPAGGKVRSLPDPVHPALDYSDAEAALAAALPRNRVAFVLFGVLTERKGVLTLLRALAELKPQAAGRAAVLLAGRIDPSIKPAVAACCAHIARRRPELWLHFEDRHLAAGEIVALMERGDVVLAPYQRFVGSSGVLLWAAQAGRPVLAQSFGLLGRLVREHRLGLTVDCSDPVALATAMGRMIDNGVERFVDRDAAAAFVAARQPESFAAKVLADVANA